jgi:hypothetical protein
MGVCVSSAFQYCQQILVALTPWVKLKLQVTKATEIIVAAQPSVLFANHIFKDNSLTKHCLSCFKVTVVMYLMINISTQRKQYQNSRGE